jgi:hypothetical protein
MRKLLKTTVTRKKKVLQKEKQKGTFKTGDEDRFDKALLIL